MKNLKKVLALVVALTMVLGTVAFAAFTDVAVDADEYTAVSTLSSLGILNGYEDGSFKPDGDITRAEFCAVVCRALGYEAAAGATNFTDVPADHWAAGYINTCAGAGIVNGMGDGTFAPSANVTYEQAVKMLVVALGFEPMAAQKGGYPTGYMVVANTYGMTKGIAVANQAAAATRGIVAQLTYNALDIPMMSQTGFGTNITFEILDGRNDRDYQTLLTGLGVAKLEGIVMGTAKYAYGTTSIDKDQVMYQIDEAYENEDFLKKAKADKDGNLPDNKDDRTIAIDVAEGVFVDDFFGVNSIVYAAKVSKAEYEIIAVMEGEDSEIVTVDLESIDDATASVIEYYASESATRTSKYNLDKDVKVYYNYGKVDSDISKLIMSEGKVVEGVDMEITLIENTGDNKYDVVVVKEYTYDRVDELEEDGETEFASANATFKFDFEDEDVDIKIFNAEGDEIEFAEIKENDVFAYITDNGKTRNFKWIEMIVLGESAVTGTVDQANNEVVYIDGTKYISTMITIDDKGTDEKDDDVTLYGVKLGDEGTFYLTRTGKIFDFDKDASVAGNYALVLQAAEDTAGFDNAYQAKLLTKSGEIVIYNFRENLTDKAKTDFAKFDKATTIDTVKAELATRLITFKLDSKNEIRDYAFVTPTTIGKNATETVEYDADGESIGNVTVEKDAVVFNVSVSSLNSVYATNVDSLVNEVKYAGYYVTNDEGDVDCVIITVGGSRIDTAQDLAIVTEVTNISINEGADEAIKVKYYVSSEDEVKEVIVVDDKDVTSIENAGFDIDDINVGDAIMFTESEGTASAIAVIAQLVGNEYKLTDYAKAIDADTDDDTTFVVGYIKDWGRVSAGTKVTTSAGSFVVKAATNGYTYEKRGNKVVIDSGSWNSGDVDKMEDGYANYFVARKVKNNVNDIITVSARVKVAAAPAEPEAPSTGSDAEAPSAGPEVEIPSAGSALE